MFDQTKSGKVRDVHGPTLSVGRFTEMHDDRTSWFTNRAAVLRSQAGHEMKLMEQNRHWVLKMLVSTLVSIPVCVAREVFDVCFLVR